MTQQTYASATFESLGLSEPLLRALSDMGFERPTPIQAAAIGPLLAGQDVIARARTGSGKTAAFGVPLLERVAKSPASGVRALVLAPTRELAQQIGGELEKMGKHLRLRTATLYGGAPVGPQRAALKKGVAVVVGTPGRTLDMLNRGALDLDDVEVAVLDEADEMLRMGFIEDVEALLAATPKERQSALFSATMPPAIRRIANAHMRKPQEIAVEGNSSTVAHIDQAWFAVNPGDKVDALWRVLAAESPKAALIFVRTRAGCAEVGEALLARGIAAGVLHGDISQAGRDQVVHLLRHGRIAVLVATDVAARGLDIDHLTHVINFDLPGQQESYVHRIGRTGRAGRAGVALSFVTRPEARRLMGWANRLKVEVPRRDVPDDSLLAEHERNRLVARIDGALAAPAPESVRQFASRCMALGEPEDIVAACVSLLAEGAVVDPFKTHARSRPPRVDAERSTQPRESHPRESQPRGRKPGGFKPGSSKPGSSKPRAFKSGPGKPGPGKPGRAKPGSFKSGGPKSGPFKSASSKASSAAPSHKGGATKGGAAKARPPGGPKKPKQGPARGAAPHAGAPPKAKGKGAKPRPGGKPPGKPKAKGGAGLGRG